MKQRTLAAEQFGATADAYLTSSVHARGADLLRLTDLSRQLVTPRSLDLGCGAGHAAFAMAAAGAQVTAYDLSEKMLAIVDSEAARRGFSDLQTRQGPAEQLPFSDATFDLVATRFSAHHWTDVASAMQEARRVLKDGGTLVVIDAIAPETPLLDTLLQTVEILRDASHVRDYRISEWSAMLNAARFANPIIQCWTLPMEFASWIARMRTSDLRTHAIRNVWADAAEEAQLHFQLRPDGSFRLDVAWLQTQVLS